MNSSFNWGLPADDSELFAELKWDFTLGEDPFLKYAHLDKECQSLFLELNNTCRHPCSLALSLVNIINFCTVNFRSQKDCEEELFREEEELQKPDLLRHYPTNPTNPFEHPNIGNLQKDKCLLQQGKTCFSWANKSHAKTYLK